MSDEFARELDRLKSSPIEFIKEYVLKDGDYNPTPEEIARVAAFVEHELDAAFMASAATHPATDSKAEPLTIKKLTDLWRETFRDGPPFTTIGFDYGSGPSFTVTPDPPFRVPMMFFFGSPVRRESIFVTLCEGAPHVRSPEWPRLPRKTKKAIRKLWRTFSPTPPRFGTRERARVQRWTRRAETHTTKASAFGRLPKVR